MELVVSVAASLLVGLASGEQQLVLNGPLLHRLGSLKATYDTVIILGNGTSVVDSRWVGVGSVYILVYSTSIV